MTATPNDSSLGLIRWTRGLTKNPSIYDVTRSSQCTPRSAHARRTTPGRPFIDAAFRPLPYGIAGLGDASCAHLYIAIHRHADTIGSSECV